MVLLHPAVYALVITAAVFLLTCTTTIKANNDSTGCDISCGEAAKLANIDYPFGFSDGCPIKLNCSNNTQVKIDEFQVFNVTRSSILVNLPAQCNRPIYSIKPLFGANYSPNRTNVFILQNCKAPLSGCLESPGFLHDPLGIGNCGSKNDNVTCFSNATAKDEALPYNAMTETNCEFVQSSIAEVDPGAGLLKSRTLGLGWWLNGSCETACGANATCEEVRTGGGDVMGFRCRCNDGFEGNGFVKGGGCRRVSNSSDCSDPKLSHHCGRTTRVGILISGFIGGAVLITGVAALCYYVRRKSSSLRKRMSTKRLLSEATGSSNISLYQYKDIERATGGFSERHRLGTGAYGTVYAAKLDNNEWVAIKRIRHRDRDSVEQVMNEVKLLSSVSHPNLVQLLGCCIESGEQILVFEYMPNGTLSQHLQRERGPGLPWTVRLAIAAETAHAIAYLHSEVNPPIYHRDIKSSNILLDYSYNSKVADFGLSRLGMIETDDSHISTAPQGTPGYLDPQYHQNFHLSDKSDVYSFGVVLVEVITALKVVDFGRPNSEVNLAALAVDRIGRGCIEEMIDMSIDLNQDAWTLASIYKVAELAFRCLAFHQDMRPSMVEVAEELEQIKLSGWDAAEENMCAILSRASSCSSAYGGSEKSFHRNLSVKKAAGSQRLLSAQQITLPDSRSSTGKPSPVSPSSPWLNAKDSPSANGLLSNMVP